MEEFVWKKNADPTPAPPLQGRGVHSKWDGVSKEVIRNISPPPKSPSPLGEGIGVRLLGIDIL